MKILAVLLSEKIVLLDDHRYVEITDCFDARGDNCEPEDATVVVAGCDELGWLTIDVSNCSVAGVN